MTKELTEREALKWIADNAMWAHPGNIRKVAEQAIAAQSAPDEREAFEAAVAAVNERGWTTSTDLARQIWDSCAAWQRAQSAPVVPEGLPRVLDEYERQTKELPCQHEIPERGCSTYNWRMSVIRDLRAMLAAAPQPAPREWPVVHTSVGCIACEGSPAGDNNPCHICGATQPAAPVAECTNEDSWNCKYCRKTETCAALKDERNFGAPPKAARQEQGDELRRLREALEEIRHANMNAPVSESNAGCIKRIKQIAERALSASAEGK